MSRAGPGQHPAGRRSAGEAAELRGDPRRARREPDQGQLGARGAASTCCKNDVAVVLIDVCMPELDGFELAAMIREHPRFQKTAIIFVSAVHLTDLDRLRGYETGAVDYVPVPVVPEILRAKVSVFAELYRKTRQLERLNDELERRVRERTAELEASTAQLRETAERLRLASEAAGFGTYDYNATVGQVYWSPYLRGIVGIAGDEPLTLESALAVVHPEHRDMVRQHVRRLRARRRGAASWSSRSSGPTARFAGSWIAGRASPTSRTVRPARDGHHPRHHGQEAQRGAPEPADGRARPSREEHPEQCLGCRPAFEPSRAIRGGVRGIASMGASRRSRARTASCVAARGPVRT